MASWWKPWTWRLSDGASHADNFVRNNPGFIEGARRLGLPVNIDTAIQLSAVLCAVRVISEGIAQQPLKVMREEVKGGKTYRSPATDHPAYRLLHRRPNSWMTSFEWRETMTIHAALAGDAFSIIGRVNRQPDELIPVHPDNMQVKLESGALSYRATIEGRQIDFDARDVFHLRGPSMDGVRGLPIVRLARIVLGLASELELQHLDLQSKGGRPSGVLTTNESLEDDAKEDLRREWNLRFGPNGEGGIAILDKNWQWLQLAMSAADQQFIENRRFQIEEVGRAWRVLPLMLMQSDKSATFASAEQFFQAHDVHTLHPWTQRWEQTIDRDLLDDDEDTYANFVMQGLLRASAADRAEYYARALGAPGSVGWMTQNEVRGLEDLDPHPNGDELRNGLPAEPAQQGGGPNAGLPFDLEDDAKAYRSSQPRGPDGKFLSMGLRLAQVVTGAGKAGKPDRMSLGRVRRPGKIAGVVKEPVKGFRYMLTNHAVQHAKTSHPNLTRGDFEALPTIVRDAKDFRPGKRGKQGEKRFEIVHRHAGVTYGVIAQVDRNRRWLSVVTLYRK